MIVFNHKMGTIYELIVFFARKYNAQSFTFAMTVCSLEYHVVCLGDLVTTCLVVGLIIF